MDISCRIRGARSKPNFPLFAFSLQLLGSALLLVACGSTRLETAAADSSSAGGSGGNGAASSGDSAGHAPDAGVAAASGDAGPPPISPEILVGLADFGASYVEGPANSTRIAVSGESFTEAWQASMTEPPATPWDAQLIILLNQPVATTDLLNVSFWVRCATAGDGGDCQTDFVFERASDPWEKSVVVHAVAGPAWAQSSEFFRPAANYGSGEAHMVFRLGYMTQVIEIGGVVVERLPG